MSGFAAVVQFDAAPIDPQVPVQLARALRFRAPDGERTHRVQHVAFAVADMHIQGDPPAGLQPLCLDGRWWIVSHARLYARRQLVSALVTAGASACVDQPDAWLILLGYRAWGSTCLTRLHGDFSFAIWDSHQRELFCATDHFGSRPLFYASRGPAIRVSNTLCALRDVLDDGELDHQFIADFLCFEFSLAPESTAYRHIRRLPPAHFLRVRPDQALQMERYWNLPTPRLNLELSAADTLERFRDLLQSAVMERLPDGPVSLTLSGGMDSTSIAAFAVRSGAQGLKSFTRGSAQQMKDPEPQLAARVAGALNLPHQLQDSDHQLPFEGWEDRMPFMPEPLNEPYWSGKHEARLALSAHSRVVVVGEGGDELLSPEFACELLGRVPVGRLATDAVRHFVRYRRRPPIGLRQSLRRLQGRSADYSQLARPPRWLNPDLVRELKLSERLSDFYREVDFPADHPTRPRGSKRLTAAISMMRGVNDPGTMGLPLEWRTPFLDLRLLEFMHSIPPLYWCSRKAILREAMVGYLPEEILRRPKTGVLANDLRDHVRDTGAPWWEHFQSVDNLGRYVDVPGFDSLRSVEKLSAKTPGTLRRDLRPVVLNYWLKSLEARKLC